MSQFELRERPADGISQLAYVGENKLLVSSWDGLVRLYDTEENLVVQQFGGEKSILAVGVMNEEDVYYGGLDHKIYRRNLVTEESTVMGKHKEAIKSLKCNPEYNILCSGSWDHSVGIWDPRKESRVYTLGQLSKVVDIATQDHILLVASLGRHINVYDLRYMKRSMAEKVQYRESSLRYQTRCVSLFPNGKGFATGSIEGRIAIDYLNPGVKEEGLKYAFKCHRSTDKESKDGVKETAHPVNSIAFHPKYGTFASGGGDGNVYMWDYMNRRRISYLEPFATSISSLAFNPSGRELAIAVSYTFEYGPLEQPIPNTIVIRCPDDAEFRPKHRS